MADEAGPMTEATLYDAADYRGTAVRVHPGQRNEGQGAAVVYSLAYLGLSRLGSLRAPAVPADPDDPFRQELRVTNVTVWEYRPDTWAPNDGERGKTWQDCSADTADLGAWAAKVRCVRVWKQRATLPDADIRRPDGAPFPIAIVE